LKQLLSNQHKLWKSYFLLSHVTLYVDRELIPSAVELRHRWTLSHSLLVTYMYHEKCFYLYRFLQGCLFMFQWVFQGR